MERFTRRRVSVGAIAALVAAWVVILVVPPAILLVQRDAWLAALERPEAQAGWDEFRNAMREQTGRQGPVQRKVPKSPEPPLRVWLRDHVGLAIAAWLVLGGTLGLCTGALVVGAATTGAGPASAAEDQSGRQRDDEKQDKRDAEDTEQRRHGR
ncbi:MAG: hypothetical protein WCR51_02740 [Planctomycetia bacterium]